MDNKKRKLTEKERKRKEEFEKLSFAMEQKGYKVKNMIIDMRQANVLGPLSVLPFLALTAWVYYKVNGFNIDGISIGLVVAAFLLFLCLVVLHELIHGITWGIFAENHFHAIDFGIVWSSLSPYCTCADLLGKWQYLLGTAMPTLVLGGATAVLGVMTNQLLLFYLAECMILSGGGDFLIILKILLYRTDKKECRYCDHPYEFGVVVFEK